MRNIILSLVVISALVAIGVGGVFADFNDYEVSTDNYFKMGSMDLTVSDSAGVEYNGPSVPALVVVETGWPDCSKDRSWDLHNAGENEQASPWVYIHFKNFDCTWVDTKTTDTTPYTWLDYDVANEILTRHLSDDGNDIGINEPQDVAIFGGVAGEDANGEPVTVPGIGNDAICLLSQTLQVEIRYSDQYDALHFPASWAAVPSAEKHDLDLSAYDLVANGGNGDGIVQLSELECEQIYLFQLSGCYSRWMNMSLRAVNFPESGFEMDYFTAGSKWENWPTNATQNQKLFFDMGFEAFGQATKPF